MAIHDLGVKVGWGTAPTDPDEVLLLDDATFGKLDNQRLGLPFGTAHIPVDISTFVQTVAWSRGRRNEFEEPRAGTCTLNLADTDSSLDPLNASSSYNVRLGAPIQIEYDGFPVGEYQVEDVEAQHQKGADVTYVSVSGTDRMAALASELGAIASSHSGDTTGARVDRVLDSSEIDWSGPRAVDTGQSTMIATTFGETALAHIQKCARTERSRFFIDRDGRVVFHERNRNGNAPSAVTFSDDGSDVPYFMLTQTSRSELFWNRAKVTADGTDYTASDSTSIDETGVTRTLSLATESATAAHAQAIADDIVSRFADDDRSTYESFTVKVRDLTAAQRGAVLGLELGDRVTVERTGPSASQVVSTHVVEGIAGWATVDDIELTFTLADETVTALFVLDDPTYGVLDTGPGLLGVF